MKISKIHKIIQKIFSNQGLNKAHSLICADALINASAQINEWALLNPLLQKIF